MEGTPRPVPGLDLEVPDDLWTRSETERAESAEPEQVASEDVEPEQVEPEVVEPEVVEPEDVEPEDVEPEQVEPEVVEPEDVESEVVEPVALAGRDGTRADLGSIGDYGIDAPGVVSTLAYLALGGFAVMLVGAVVNVVAVMVVGLVVCLMFAITALLLVSSSRSGKLRERARVIRFADLAPDDYVLDLGCGRGLLVVEAARKVTEGLAVGVDLWSAKDQSRNEPTAPLDNAVVERVADRVEIVTGDGRHLPYVDGAFDAVVSSMVLHNFGGAHGPSAAVREAARVLRPGGRLVVVDLAGSRDYVRVLRDLGWSQVARSRRIWRLFPPVRYVTATKPDAPLTAAPATP